MDRSVIIAMAVFAYLGIAKDALVGYYTYIYYEDQGMNL